MKKIIFTMSFVMLCGLVSQAQTQVEVKSNGTAPAAPAVVNEDGSITLQPVAGETTGTSTEKAAPADAKQAPADEKAQPKATAPVDRKQPRAPEKTSDR